MNTNPNIAGLFAYIFQTIYYSFRYSKSHPYLYQLQMSNRSLDTCKARNLATLAESSLCTQHIPVGHPPKWYFKDFDGAHCQPNKHFLKLSVNTSSFRAIWRKSFRIPLNKKGMKSHNNN